MWAFQLEMHTFHRSSLIAFSPQVYICCFVHFDMKLMHFTHFKLQCAHFAKINFWEWATDLIIHGVKDIPRSWIKCHMTRPIQSAFEFISKLAVFLSQIRRGWLYFTFAQSENTYIFFKLKWCKLLPLVHGVNDDTHVLWRITRWGDEFTVLAEQQSIWTVPVSLQTSHHFTCKQ